MQLVVMMVALAMAAAGGFSCHLKNVSIPVERCGKQVCINTRICEGLCKSQDTVYESPDEAPEHQSCNGEWSYEEKQVEGCPGSITYPVATKCHCSLCDMKDTYCSRHFSHIPSC